MVHSRAVPKCVGKSWGSTARIPSVSNSRVTIALESLRRQSRIILQDGETGKAESAIWERTLVEFALPWSERGRGRHGEQVFRRQDATLGSCEWTSCAARACARDPNRKHCEFLPERGRDYSVLKPTVVYSQEKGESVAVRMALGETQIVNETREFLEAHGVDLSVFKQNVTERSKTILLVKNLPANTKETTLWDLFDQK